MYKIIITIVIIIIKCVLCGDDSVPFAVMLKDAGKCFAASAVNSGDDSHYWQLHIQMELVTE